jgi:hypothetical protein
MGVYLALVYPIISSLLFTPTLQSKSVISNLDTKGMYRLHANPVTYKVPELGNNIGCDQAQ